MTTNLLTPEQASFETGIGGWALVADPAPQNLLPAEQATFETNTIGGAGACGWSNWSAGQVVAWASDHAAEGTHAIKLSSASTLFAQAAPRTSPGYTVFRQPVIPGREYTFLFSVEPEVAADAVQAGIQFKDAAFANVGAQINAQVPNPPVGQYTQAAVYGVAPAGAAFAEILATVSFPANGGGAWLDKAGWFEGHVTVWSPPVRVTATQASEGDDGTHSLALTRLGPAGTVEAQTTTTNAATPNKTYTGMASFKGDAGLVGRVYLDFLNASNAVLASAIGTATLTTGDWHRAHVSAVTPTGTTKARVRVAAMNVNTGVTLLVDKAGLMDGDTLAWAPGGSVVPASVIVSPDPFRHRMAVAIVDLPSDAPISLTRILPGARRELVRHVQNADIVLDGIALTDDYDVPTDTLYRYEVRQGAAVVATSDMVSLPSDGSFWLGEPNTSTMVQVIPAANAIPSWRREAPIGVHRVLGRPDPVVVTDVRWWADGELTLYTLTENQRQQVGSITSYGVTLGFYGPAEILGGVGRIYLVSTTIDERRVSPRGTETPREWRMDITQVAEPTGDATIPIITTWQSVVTSYALWSDVVAGEQDWLDVMQGTTLPSPGWEW